MPKRLTIPFTMALSISAMALGVRMVLFAVCRIGLPKAMAIMQSREQAARCVYDKTTGLMGRPFLEVRSAFSNIWPGVLMIVANAIAFAIAFWHYRQTVDPTRCRRCRYDLTGNISGVCPECGTAAIQAPTL